MTPDEMRSDARKSDRSGDEVVGTNKKYAYYLWMRAALLASQAELCERQDRTNELLEKLTRPRSLFPTVEPMADGRSLVEPDSAFQLMLAKLRDVESERDRYRRALEEISTPNERFFGRVDRHYQEKEHMRKTASEALKPSEGE